MPNLNRRTFLGSLAAALPSTRIVVKQKAGAGPAFRFAVPGCEFELTVRSYGKLTSEDLEFIDEKTKRRFCLPATGRERGCVAGFRGALSVARYKFSPSFRDSGPMALRERVITIDYDSRINPRPPEEESVKVEEDEASDIQAFGFSPDDMVAMKSFSNFVSPWALMRQDLYFDNQKAPVLILHWKHTLESILLVDVIPGDRTRLLSD